MTNKAITINKGTDLKLPHDIVDLCKLGNVGHIDVEKGLVVCSNDNCHHGCGSHDEG